MCKDVRLAHQIRTILLKISFLWKADIDVEELGEVSEKNAVHSGRRLAQEVVLVVQQIGNRFQVLERCLYWSHCRCSCCSEDLGHVYFMLH